MSTTTFPQIKNHGNGKAVYRDGEMQSTHCSYAEALASLSSDEQRKMKAIGELELKQLEREAALADELGPDFGALIFPDYGHDANT